MGGVGGVFECGFEEGADDPDCVLPFAEGDEFGDEVVVVAPGALEEEEEFFGGFGVGGGGGGGGGAELGWEEGAGEEGVDPGGHVAGVSGGGFGRDGEAVEGGEFVVGD